MENPISIIKSYLKLLKKRSKYDDCSDFHDLYDEVADLIGSKSWSGAGLAKSIKYFNPKRKRFYQLYKAINNTSHLPGDIVELGTYKGHSTLLMAKATLKNDKPKIIYAIDSFEGLSSPSDNDLSIKYPVSAANGFDSLEGLMSADINQFIEVSSPYNNIIPIKGFVPAVLNDTPHLSQKVYSLIHIDLDLYEPIKYSLEFFAPRLLKGGIIVLDDYGSLNWPGAFKSVNEFYNKNKDSYTLIETESMQAILVKIS